MVYVHTDNVFAGRLFEVAKIQCQMGQSLIKFTKPAITRSDYYTQFQGCPVVSGAPLEPIDSFKRQIVEMQIPVRSSFTYQTLDEAARDLKGIGH